MKAVTDMRLHKVGVVITAEFYNPSMLNKDFLINNKVIPNDWTEDQTMSTPIVSVIKFDNGIQWVVDQQRLDISKECDAPFGGHMDDELHRCAASYIKILPHVPYQSIGLNCVVSIADENPLQWMTHKFLKSELHFQDINLVPRFVIKVNDMVLNFAFGDGTALRDGRKTRSVIVDCNCHFSGPFSSNKDMQFILHGWKDTKSIIASKLNEVLK